MPVNYKQLYAKDHREATIKAQAYTIKKDREQFYWIGTGIITVITLLMTAFTAGGWAIGLITPAIMLIGFGLYKAWPAIKAWFVKKEPAPLVEPSLGPDGIAFANDSKLHDIIKSKIEKKEHNASKYEGYTYMRHKQQQALIQWKLYESLDKRVSEGHQGYLDLFIKKKAKHKEEKIKILTALIAAVENQGISVKIKHTHDANAVKITLEGANAKKVGTALLKLPHDTLLNKKLHPNPDNPLSQYLLPAVLNVTDMLDDNAMRKQLLNHNKPENGYIGQLGQYGRTSSPHNNSTTSTTVDISHLKNRLEQLQKEDNLTTYCRQIVRQ